MMRSEIVIARSHRASRDARLSTGYGDETIQGTKGVLRSLDCFPPGPKARGSQSRLRVDPNAICAAYLAQAVAGRISSLRKRARSANAP
jgi:hypothetical protein